MSEREGMAFDCIFSGTYTHQLDAKGRVSLPAKFRKQLATTSVRLVPRNGVILLFTTSEFGVWVQEFFEGGKPDRRSAKDDRTMFSLLAHAEDVEIDSAGRINVSPELCARAGLGKEVKIVGMFDHIQIMSPEKYASLDAESEEDL
ncbi:MraZ family transcriptional regulator [bacterium]|nr:MraZ family transcriptional regulator [bacterium]